MKNDSKFLWSMFYVVVIFVLAFMCLGFYNYTAAIVVAYVVLVMVIVYGKFIKKWKPSERFLQNTIYVGYGTMALAAIGAVTAIACTMLGFGDYHYTALLCGGVVMVATGLFLGADQLKTELYPKITITEKQKSDIAIVPKVRLDNWDDDDDDGV